jgi:hypothetical protein
MIRDLLEEEQPTSEDRLTRVSTVLAIAQGQDRAAFGLWQLGRW